MKKSSKYIQIGVTILLLCAVVYGIFLANVKQSLNNDGECDITEDACTLVTLGEEVSVNFEQRPVAEEELFIRFDLPENLQIENAWIEGINMYMGRTPVMFENANDNTRGVTFLGSCNLQQMQWQLNLQLKKDDTEQASSLTFTFMTYRE